MRNYKIGRLSGFEAKGYRILMVAIFVTTDNLQQTIDKIDIKNHLFETELFYHERYEGHQDTLHSIFEYIEVFYNQPRRHSTLEYLCPSKY